MDNQHHIGIRLRDAREAMGLTQGDVAEALRIKPAYIDAIERLDTAALPSVGYVLGYVRSYAKRVGMNGDEAVAAYKVDSAVPENLGMRDRPHFVPRNKIRLPKGFYSAMTALSCAAVLAFWYGSNTDAQSAQQITVPDADPIQTVEVAPVPKDMIVIKANNPSWVQVKDKNGRQIISRIFLKGESWQIAGTSGATLTVRDSGAIELFAGNTSLGPVGEKGFPVANMPLRLPDAAEPLSQAATLTSQ